MNTNILKLVAALAWGGVAVSSASSANAIAVTTQAGDYAACASQSQYLLREFCPWTYDGVSYPPMYQTNYTQQIKFVTTSCNGGGCTYDASTVYVDFAYPVGRKTSMGWVTCSGMRAYDFGSCAC
jgi:hypothetical protein